ncbi:CYTH-like domain-containing protein [Phaeosphaeriaceae sp. PMI808]|nr:CYTH-like domain-containing protein [Phaeosphaeriaceae sp. PMI808]
MDGAASNLLVKVRVSRIRSESSMMPRSLLTTSCILEVERKFRSLAVRELATNSGHPPFRSIRSLGQRTIHDVYYDRSGLLSSAGVWVRQRNGDWEAKVKRGGNFNNSRFEELSDPYEISRCVKDVTGIESTEQDLFGLKRIATLSTARKTWIADYEFKIVLDTMDFGHIVGEVELQQQIDFITTKDLPIEEQKQRTMQEMDDKIAKFMGRYSWAFCPGIPKGKLTAYFEQKAT